MSESTAPAPIRIAQHGYALEVMAHLGGALAGLQFQGQEVLRRADPEIDEPLASAGFALMPFANRIAQGRFRIRARTVQLSPNAPGQRHPLHGQAWRKPWTVESHESGRLALGYEHPAGEWPWAYRAGQVFTLTQSGIEVALELENRAAEPMPAGIGWHPYLRRTPAARLRAAVKGVWLADAQCLPTTLASPQSVWDFRDGAPAPPTLVDHCYTEWNGQAELVLPEEQLCVRIEAEQPLRWLHVYSPPGEAFLCLEPVSHMPDALNRSEPPAVSGLRWLAPGETLRACVTLRVSHEPCGG
jgi:aldose 1-epimerase